MSGKPDFADRRWLAIVLRSIHLVGVVLMGAAIIGNGAYQTLGGALMLSSGLGLFGIELWRKPRHVGDLAGIFVVLKLLLVLAMVLLPNYALALFWLLLIASSMISHAPYSFRHIRPFG
jgi:hypothetical protein